jgi:hypothetical protein
MEITANLAVIEKGVREPKPKTAQNRNYPKPKYFGFGFGIGTCLFAT